MTTFELGKGHSSIKKRTAEEAKIVLLTSPSLEFCFPYES
jgi:hypothetical protein